MKKIVIAFVAGVLFATAGTAAATSVIERVTASVRTDYSVEIDGQKVALKNAPLAYNGSSYLPVKEISELLGKEVGFDSGVIQINTPDTIEQNNEPFTSPIENLTLVQIQNEIKSLPGVIMIYERSVELGKYEGDELEKVKSNIAEYKQRLAELEARKAEFEAE